MPREMHTGSLAVRYDVSLAIPTNIVSRRAALDPARTTQAKLEAETETRW